MSAGYRDGGDMQLPGAATARPYCPLPGFAALGKIDQLLTVSYKVGEGLGLSWVILNIHTYTDLYCLTMFWSMRTEYVAVVPYDAGVQ